MLSSQLNQLIDAELDQEKEDVVENIDEEEEDLEDSDLELEEDDYDEETEEQLRQWEQYSNKLRYAALQSRRAPFR